ncbi:Luc7-like protein 3 [Perkinsus olseni]|uniref:Luc7-like protein 3 n=2 Tax=Perkinsus olseni TaxID=32597 RepID=A0A7J6QE94_PEROL|nr:Luc7-like protein 3 [Perkinsus olseni]
MEEARALLDQLMGRDRNVSAAEKVKIEEKKINWMTQTRYCPYFLLDFCPHDLFVNTKADMGPCNKEHCEYTKSRFEKWEDCAEKRAVVDKYSRELLSFLEYLETQLAHKIRRGKARVSAEIPDIEIPPQNKEQIDELKRRIHGIVKEAEELAEKGRIAESEKRMGQAEPLNSKIRELSGEKYMMMTRTEFVCDVCGVLVTLNENDPKANVENHEHARGKQHQGWAKIRETISTLREKLLSNGPPPSSASSLPPKETPASDELPSTPPPSEASTSSRRHGSSTASATISRTSEEYTSKVEDWRDYLAKMRARQERKHRHHHHRHEVKEQREDSRTRSRSRSRDGSVHAEQQEQQQC